ncbi:MAG TPA: cupredoxin domain-containing protein [Actinomycetota bacterium]|nr:cupredoxin domain-containing protein [Actinomycetota bacterium]
MHRRALLIVATVAVIATACNSVTTPAVDFGTGSFFPFVVDSQDDVGQGNAVALTPDGLPFVSYFGFAAKLAEGQVAIPRPFGAPNVPGVMLSTSTSNGLWQRGAIEMESYASSVLTPQGVSVPFGPVATNNLDLDPKNANGTAIAVDDQGTVYVAWTSGNTVSYGTSALGSNATVDRVFSLKGEVSQSGPIGRPGIALDGSGNPWIAFTVEAADGLEVHVANLAGTKWSDQVVATFAGCNGCPSPQPTGIGFVGGSATVIYADPGAKEIVALTQNGTTWARSTVASGVAGFGLSFAVGGDKAVAAFYTGDGAVDAATLAKGAWSTTKVTDVAADPSETVNGSDASSTAAAVAGDGTEYVAWDDQGVHLASGTDSFSPVDLGSTVSTGTDPSLSATDQGAVALGWYDTLAQNQMLGYLGNVSDIVVARPSPSLTLSLAPSPSGGQCGKNGQPVLDVVAKGLAFDPTCLVATAGKAFDLNFDNEDSTTTHNVAIYTDSSASKDLFIGDGVVGVAKTTYNVDALDAGTYYFRCDYHPTQMFGDFVVVK